MTTEAHSETVSNKPRTSWDLDTFKPVFRTTFETPWAKIWIELVNDVTLNFLG